MARLIAIVGVCLCVAAPAAASPILVNAGFETGDFTGWTVGTTLTAPSSYGVATDGILLTGTSFLFGSSFTAVKSGEYAAYEVGNGGQGLILTQTVAFDAGTYRIGYFLTADSEQSAYGFSGEISINGTPIFLDTNPGFIGGDAIFREYSGTFTTTGGLLSVTYLVRGSGTAAAGFSMDDAFITDLRSAPEPASLLLLGTALLGTGLRRWRRRL